MPSDALELIGVTKAYEVGGAELIALENVDLNVAADEVVTLLGPSGSGKTTLLSIAGGLLSATTGRVIVAGEDITRLSARRLTAFRRERVGFIFQAVNLVPFLTARENLLVVAELARRRRGEAKRRADRLLEELGLGSRLNNLPSQLSGGERQRVAIGRALMNAPELVLIDEPTSALDSDLGQQVMELIVSEVKARGAAAIVVTHDARMTRYGDRILNMADGRIVGGVSRAEWTRNRPEPVSPAREEPEVAPLRMPVTQRQAERRAAAAALVTPTPPAPPPGRAPEFGGRGARFGGGGLRDVSQPEVPAPSGEWGAEPSLSGEWPSAGDTVTDDRSLSGEWPRPAGQLPSGEWLGPREIEDQPLRRLGRRKRPADQGPGRGLAPVDRQGPTEPSRPPRPDTAEVRRAVTEWDDATGAPVLPAPEREAVDWEDLVEEEPPALWRPGTPPGAPDADDEPDAGGDEPGWDRFAEERTRSYRRPAHGDPGEPPGAADEDDDEPLPDLWRPTAGAAPTGPGPGGGRPAGRRPSPRPAGAPAPGATSRPGPAGGGARPGPGGMDRPGPAGGGAGIPGGPPAPGGAGGPGGPPAPGGMDRPGPGGGAGRPGGRGRPGPGGAERPAASGRPGPGNRPGPAGAGGPGGPGADRPGGAGRVGGADRPGPGGAGRPGVGGAGRPGLGGGDRPGPGLEDPAASGRPGPGGAGRPGLGGGDRPGPGGAGRPGLGGGERPGAGGVERPAASSRPGSGAGGAERPAAAAGRAGGAFRHGGPLPGGPVPRPDDDQAAAAAGPWPSGSWPIVPSVATTGRGPGHHTSEVPAARGPSVPDWDSLGEGEPEPDVWLPETPPRPIPPSQQQRPVTMTTPMQLPPQDPPPSIWPRPQRPPRPGMPLTGEVDAVPTGDVPAPGTRRPPEGGSTLGRPGGPRARRTTPPGGVRSVPSAPGGFGGRRHTPPHGTPAVPGGPGGFGGQRRTPPPRNEFGQDELDVAPRPVDPSSTGSHEPLLPPRRPPTTTGQMPNVHQPLLPGLPGPPPSVPTGQTPRVPGARTTSSNPAIPPLVPGLPPAGGRPSRHDQPTGGHRPLAPAPAPAPPPERSSPPAPRRPAPQQPPAPLGPPTSVRRVRPEDQGRTPGPFSQQFPIVEDMPPTDHPLGPRDLAPTAAPAPGPGGDLDFDELFGKAKEKERDRDARRGGKGKPKAKPRKKAARRPAADRTSDGSPSLGTQPDLIMPGTKGVPPLVPGLPPAGGRASRHDDPDTSPLPPTGPGPIPRSGRPDRRERRLPPEGPELRPAPPDRPSLPPPESLRHEQTADGWPTELEWRPPDRQNAPPPDGDDGWWDDDR